MKIKITQKWGGCDAYKTVENYAEHKLDGDDYGKGAMEAAADTARNNSKAIGRLMDVLAGKGVLTALEVEEIVEGYARGEAEFEI